MERKLYLLSPLQAEFYENESDRMYPDDVMDGRALAVYGADILQKMQERADHVGEDLMLYGFNRYDSESCGGSELGAKVIERRVCSFKETGAGRNVDADRWTGTVGVQGWSVLAEVSGFYDRAV